MRIRGLVIFLCALLALVPLACSGDDDEAAPTSPDSTVTVPDTSTGAVESPPTETPPPTAPPATADPAVIADAAGKTAAQKSARIATNVRVNIPGTGQNRFSGSGAFDFDRRVGEMTLKLLEGEGTGTAAGQSK